ncbi:MAG TPA: hypothetical protein VJA46_04765 [Acidimicrobiia bacterium]|nr:hypothetical protein [Acidimicrobiia bacterium]
MLFDLAGYERHSPHVDPDGWCEEQSAAGADRILTPGRWIPWSGAVNSLRAPLEQEIELAAERGATALIAMDYRWLTRGIDPTSTLFEAANVPIAIALSHRDDPLSAGQAVDGLITLCKKSDHLSLFRSDHGAIGALAFGAAHAALGLRTATRHLYPPDASGGGGWNGDRSQRLFVSRLLDWYTAFKIAGWGASEIEMVCPLACCEGAPLGRFLDERLADQAQIHNETALAELATYVINAPRNDRRRLFAQRCRDAIDLYDRLGSMAIHPKAQLEAWAVWA